MISAPVKNGDNQRPFFLCKKDSTQAIKIDIILNIQEFHRNNNDKFKTTNVCNIFLPTF